MLSSRQEFLTELQPFPFHHLQIRDSLFDGLSLRMVVCAFFQSRAAGENRGFGDFHQFEQSLGGGFR